MRIALLKESDRLEHSLSMLATIGSTSPYVGLFGTVWGIMGAFQSIGATGSTNLVEIVSLASPGSSNLLLLSMGAAGILVDYTGGNIARTFTSDKLEEIEAVLEAEQAAVTSALPQE